MHCRKCDRNLGSDGERLRDCRRRRQRGVGTIVFDAGETTKTIVVGVTGDRKREPDEWFSVNLSGASGATIFASGTGLIRNDDR